MRERDEIQNGDIKDLRKLLETKVPWIIFIAIMVLLIGLFGYFATADSNLDTRIIKQTERVNNIQEDTNNKFLQIKDDLGQIKGALNIKK